MLFGIVSGVVGGLFIFLLGMKNMSDGMQAIAGARLRKMINAVTDNRLVACGTGVLITSLIQSSSATTVMVVGFVNAGLMTLMQAIGVILGANVGTSVTAWIVSLNIMQYGLPVLGIAGLTYLFSKEERTRYSAMILMGIGMVFFGLELMKDGLQPLRELDAFVAWFSTFEPKTYFGVAKCVLTGALLTAVVQSSSATIAITIVLARGGVIGFDTAVALVLGQNIGTTITAYLASLGTSTAAKRAAYAHIMVNVVTACFMIPVFFVYIRILATILGDNIDIAKRIAFSHTLFNVLMVCIFLPLMKPLAALIHKIAPDKPHKEPPRLTFLDIRLLDTPAFGIQQSADEIMRMNDDVSKMMNLLKEALLDPNESKERDNHIFHKEQILDVMQKEIAEFLGNILAGSVPHDIADEARQQLRIADEYESISDYITAIYKLNLKMHDNNLVFSEEGKRHILDLHQYVFEYLEVISEAVKERNKEIISKANVMGNTITHMMKEYRQAHIKRLENRHISILTSLTFVDVLQSYRKIKDHALNIAETVAGEK